MEYIRFGLDYARFNFEPCFRDTLFQTYFGGLSANSNYKTINWNGIDFKCTFIHNRNKKILIFNFDGFPVFDLVEILDGGLNTHTSYVMNFYSAFFYFNVLDIFFWAFIEEYKDVTYCTRIDLALDIPVSIPEFLKKGYVTNFKRGAKFGLNDEDGTFQTWYLGAKGCSNKKHFIRVYDKLMDSQKKSKMALFMNYFTYKNVTRIEAQINSQSCRVFDVRPEKLLDDSFLRKVYRSVCINPRGTFFRALDDFDENTEVIPYTKPEKSEILYDMDYAKRMLGYAKTLKGMGFDCIEFLKSNL